MAVRIRMNMHNRQTDENEAQLQMKGRTTNRENLQNTT